MFSYIGALDLANGSTNRFLIVAHRIQEKALVNLKIPGAGHWINNLHASKNGTRLLPRPVF